MKTFLLYLAALVVFAVLVPAAEVVNIDKNGLALQGYDPVGYFTDVKPVKGSPEFTATYNGATYQFASAEHRDMFKAAPQNMSRSLADSAVTPPRSTNWRRSKFNISRSCTIG